MRLKPEAISEIAVVPGDFLVAAVGPPAQGEVSRLPLFW